MRSVTGDRAKRTGKVESNIMIDGRRYGMNGGSFDDADRDAGKEKSYYDNSGTLAADSRKEQ